jgi:hypothetical protein
VLEAYVLDSHVLDESSPDAVANPIAWNCSSVFVVADVSIARSRIVMSCAPGSTEITHVVAPPWSPTTSSTVPGPAPWISTCAPWVESAAKRLYGPAGARDRRQRPGPKHTRPPAIDAASRACCDGTRSSIPSSGTAPKLAGS